MGEAVVAWCRSELQSIFGLDVSEDIVQYILSIESEEEVEEYINDLVQGSESKKHHFIEELKARWQKCNQPSVSDPVQLYRRKDESSEVQKLGLGDQPRKGRRKGRNKQEAVLFVEAESAVEEVKTPLDLAKVCTKEEQDILQRDSNKSQKLLKKLMSGGETPGKMEVSYKDLLPHQESRFRTGLEKALQHKDKLIEFDKTSVRRTQVIDDESDYFATDSNQWLSRPEREALRKRERELLDLRHASRLSRKITIDFAGRQILEQQDSLSEYHSRLDETVQDIKSGTMGNMSRDAKLIAEKQLRDLVNPNLLLPAPVWVEQISSGPHRTSSFLEDSERIRLRIQDRELQEMSDEGMCLSMHQPWASLLIKGIKRVEGRTWYSSHRGRLWIAAAAKRPAPQEISQLEASYRMLLPKGTEFPKDYPTGCLLGCVNVTDCTSQEQFKDQYPDLCQESGSPFVFICTHPQELIVKFPIKGKHKIWKLESKIHQGAKKGLMKQKDIEP
ncbi:activating signal cointegrator 1 isoform X4 [Rhinatrema bivittatum]|uniref:activating signal cointegrator 1 isoform X4 n=1 Tax=Rhinatrema bivittatum TaxID=194408 RepID=UPI001125BC36|nr:activating signal cointegrator 1 isoform X4 [Rhinatrema bivittatum]